MPSIQGLLIWTPSDYFRDSTQRGVNPAVDPHNICRISLHVGQDCKSGWKRKCWVGLANTFSNKLSFQWRTVGRELDWKALTWHLRQLNIPLHKKWALNESFLLSLEQIFNLTRQMVCFTEPSGKKLCWKRFEKNKAGAVNTDKYLAGDWMNLPLCDVLRECWRGENTTMKVWGSLKAVVCTPVEDSCYFGKEHLHMKANLTNTTTVASP